MRGSRPAAPGELGGLGCAGGQGGRAGCRSGCGWALWWASVSGWVVFSGFRRRSAERVAASPPAGSPDPSVVGRHRRWGAGLSARAQAFSPRPSHSPRGRAVFFDGCGARASRLSAPPPLRASVRPRSEQAQTRTRSPRSGRADDSRRSLAPSKSLAPPRSLARGAVGTSRIRARPSPGADLGVRFGGRGRPLAAPGPPNPPLRLSLTHHPPKGDPKKRGPTPTYVLLFV